MTVNSGEELPDAYSIAVLSNEGTTNSQCEPESGFVCLFQASNSFGSQMCLDSQLNFQNNSSIKMENMDAYSASNVEVDIEKGKSETPKTSNDTFNLKMEDPLTVTNQHLQRALQREISLQVGGKFMQLLIDYSLVLSKFIIKDKSGNERVHDTPNNRLRKYKRSASFNSRKVALLFSVLSSVGTMILIYLTLRVRQMADLSVHV